MRRPQELVKQLRREADLLQVAERLGMRVWRRESEVPLALCPFHKDHRPSLHLYRKPSGPDYYHCYACGAHGDVFDLVLKKANLGSFVEAVDWLASALGQEVGARDFSEASTSLGLRDAGLTKALAIFQSETQAEGRLLERFARTRGYEADFLRNCEVFGASARKLTRNSSVKRDRLAQARLEAAGLLVHRDRLRENTQPNLPFPGPTDFFWDRRIIFAIRDRAGGLMGFAGRATDAAARPKYLYSKGFKRSHSLYRLNQVLSSAFFRKKETGSSRRARTPSTLDVYLVEGFLDALRFESLGLNACAVLGSTLTLQQAAQLADLAIEVARLGGVLALHLFLDQDEAGREGTARALARLWQICPELHASALIDVVSLPPSALPGKDPDAVLRESDKEGAEQTLSSALVPPALFLLANRLTCEPSEVDHVWATASALTQQWVLQSLEADIGRDAWRLAALRLRPFSTSVAKPPEPAPIWQDSLENFFAVPSSVSEGKGAQTRRPRRLHAPPKDIQAETQRLQLAHHLALASRHRREFPIDESTWLRLNMTFDVMASFYKAVLEIGSSQQLEPYLAVYLPKASGGLRLKALPCAEDLTIQQYMLDELLRTYRDNPSFANYIPAVRWQNGRLWTTGWSRDGEPVPREGAVSFAYQIDMDALEGRVRPGKRTLFRPFFDCWKGFIGRLSESISEFQEDRLYCLRLDIRGFYDHLRRSAVNDALRRPLENALSCEDFDPFSVAPLFQPSSRASHDEPTSHLNENIAHQRARALVDWFCNQSFHYTYCDPTTGQANSSPFEDIGIPQGPDLSAYLANIALFPLDYELSKAIVALSEETSDSQTMPAQSSPVEMRADGQAAPPGSGARTRRAVYARYVDDIVLISQRPDQLEALRSKVQHELSKIGLSLSRKTEPLPPMSQSELRRWLTDQRSLGAGYGPIPGVDPELLLATQRWPDAGIELDRGTALQLLHGHSPPDVLENSQDVFSNIALARQADLRPGDESVVAKLLWLLVAASQGDSGTTSPLQTLGAFRKLWNDSKPARLPTISSSAAGGLPEAFHATWHIFAWMEGLLLALRARPDRHPGADSPTKRRWEALRRFLASQVGRGLCDRILEAGPDQRDEEGVRLFEHQRASWYTVLLAAASEIFGAYMPKGEVPDFSFWRNLKLSSPVLFRHACSLHSAWPNSTTLEPLTRLPNSGRSEEGGLLELLQVHESIARLVGSRDSSTLEGEAPDPLQPMVDRVRTRIRPTRPEATPLLQTLYLWLPGTEDEQQTGQTWHESSYLVPAVAALVNVARTETVTLLSRRPWMQRALAHFHGLPAETRFLPVPPGVSQSILIAIAGKRLHVFFLFPSETVPPVADLISLLSESFRPKQLSWEPLDGPSAADVSWRLLSADLDGWEVQEPCDQPLVQRDDAKKIQILLEIVSAYRSLTRELDTESLEAFAVSCCHLLRRQSVDSGKEGVVWSVLGLDVERAKIGSQAFLRQREAGSLLAEPVPAEGSDFWRIGTALADLWGGIDKGISDPPSTLSSTALYLDDRQDLMVETISRITLAQLRGVFADKPGRLAKFPGENLPLRVERSIGRVEKFANAFRSGDPLTTLALGLGCFLQTRFDLAFGNRLARDQASGASAATVLAKATRVLLGADARLHRALPLPSTWPDWLPQRRPAAAWFAVAERLSLLPSTQDSCSVHQAIAGYRLLGLGEMLRAQALERWAALAPENRRADLWALNLAAWGIDEEAVLVSGEASQDLLQFLEGLSTRSSPQDLAQLDAVTPLGWFVVLGALSGLTPGNDLRPGVPLQDTRELEALQSLPSLLAAAPKSKESGSLTKPSEGKLDFLLTEDQLQGFLRALELLDDREGINVAQEESHRLHFSARSGILWEVRSDLLGNREVPLWALRYVWLRDPRERPEEGTSSPSGIVQRRAALSTFQGRLVGAAWVSSDLAALAGLDFAPTFPDEIPVPSIRSLRPDSTVAQPPDIPEDAETPGRSKGQTAVEDKGPILPNTRPLDSGPTSHSHSEVLDGLRALQRRDWVRRGASKRQNTARIALLQWSVCESYRHPIFEACGNVEQWRNLGKDRVSEVDYQRIEDELKRNRCYRRDLLGPPLGFGDNPATLPSCSEHRRRRILSDVLAACSDLKVDILLLPEYSVRPDTVAWLADPQNISLTTAVWAGTYRIPPASSLLLANDPISPSEREPWSAVLSAVLPSLTSEPRRILWRAKKYPSHALGEVFCPNGDRLGPLFPLELGGEAFDPKRFVLELVCSEIFLATSPTNWTTLASSLAALRAKFYANQASVEAALDQVHEDVRDLGNYLSYQSVKQFPRRSILLVPAMTPRTTDYAAFGQLNYLSAGLTTVFCNAVLGRHSIGNSCFIGNDCWDRTDRDSDRGMPSLSPYHGEIPGIFHQYSHNRGWLGRKEQALVVADVDPLHAVEGRPRTQSLPPPLELVAHIPIIESWRSRRDQDPHPTETGCLCREYEAFSPKDDFFHQLLDRLQAGLRSTADDPEPAKLTQSLRQLAELAGHDRRGWLSLRADAYEERHRDDPVLWPPPVALDWLWVDLGRPGDVERYPAIEVPPFRSHPDEAEAEQLEERKDSSTDLGNESREDS